MKKTLAYGVIGTLFALGACQDKMITGVNEDGTRPASRACAAMDVLETQLAADPKLAGRLAAIEEHTRSVIARGGQQATTITIPVVVNVIYRTQSENISLEQIQSQLDVLNADFNAANDDVSQTPDIFQDVVADMDINFVLKDVVRKYSPKQSWGLNDAMKYSRRGGIDATNPTENLNIWVVNLLAQGQSVYLGYAQFPGGSAATDGVVVGHNFFGTTGPVIAPYDQGRTTTHEVGHWLNLRHIWGDAACGNDFVEDTPVHNTYNFGCPAYPKVSTCAGEVEMTMNYMDYTDDPCMFMFSEGQKARALAVFAAGGPRASFVN